MIRSDENEAYATEVLRRYDEFRAWTIGNWPNHDDPLASGDFSAGRKELAVLLDARLDGVVARSPLPAAADGGTGDPDAGQFLPVTPAPWP
ncbi:MAG: hypothetical protein H7234_04205 [Herminiimonas sp.]|nr:hypothetical protein [Herminiimonas sp.]